MLPTHFNTWNWFGLTSTKRGQSQLSLYWQRTLQHPTELKETRTQSQRSNKSTRSKDFKHIIFTGDHKARQLIQHVKGEGFT